MIAASAPLAPETGDYCCPTCGGRVSSSRRLLVDYARLCILWDGAKIFRRKTETDLFIILYEALGETVTYERIYSRLWGVLEPPSNVHNNLCIHVCRLRKALLERKLPFSIKTVYATGLILIAKQ